HSRPVAGAGGLRAGPGTASLLAVAGRPGSGPATVRRLKAGTAGFADLPRLRRPRQDRDNSHHMPNQDIPADIIERARAIRLACFDVDGTLTDGRLWFDTDGREAKAF